MKLTHSEANAMIAETFFGLVPCDAWTPCRDPIYGMMKQDCGHDHCYPRTTNYGDCSGCPKYTTNPAASKALRDKLARTADRVVHVTAWTRAGNLKYSASISDCGKNPADYLADSATEELAVVLCALKSIGIDAEIGDEK